MNNLLIIDLRIAFIILNTLFNTIDGIIINKWKRLGVFTSCLLSDDGLAAVTSITIQISIESSYQVSSHSAIRSLKAESKFFYLFENIIYYSRIVIRSS